MNVSDFDYELPESCLLKTRSRIGLPHSLLMLDKKTGAIEHHIFRDIIDALNPGDCLVINNTRVIPARLLGVKEDTGAAIEVLLLKRRDNDIWETLVNQGRR